MSHYFVVWGESTHAVRSGEGDPRTAALDAFGVYQPERMTVLKVDLTTMRSDAKRTRFIAETLLPAHRERMLALGDRHAVERTDWEIARIERLWKPEWQRADRRKASTAR